jgi:hypothetical protein
MTGKTPDGKKVTIALDYALKTLPTLCATDYKGPYGKDGYQKQMQKRLKPLRDTLPHSIGAKLTPAFAEWFMGWPIRWTALRKRSASKRSATAKSRSSRRRHG